MLLGLVGGDPSGENPVKHLASVLQAASADFLNHKSGKLKRCSSLCGWRLRTRGCDTPLALLHADNPFAVAQASYPSFQALNQKRARIAARRST